MSKVKPMELISQLSGKVCGHSNKYFAVRYGTQYTGTICNPYTGEPTEKQIAVRQKFADTYAAMAELTEEQKDAYKEAFLNMFPDMVGSTYVVPDKIILVQ